MIIAITYSIWKLFEELVMVLSDSTLCQKYVQSDYFIGSSKSLRILLSFVVEGLNEYLVKEILG